jgi:hypothetical protein
VQVGLESCDAGAEPRAVDLQVFHYTLDVVARLGERDALDQSTASILERDDFSVNRFGIPKSSGL